jgi:hypothetical protein
LIVRSLLLSRIWIVPASKVDGCPAQAKSLTAAQAVDDEQRKRCVERIRPGSPKELPGLVSGPWSDGYALPLRQFDQAGDVARGSVPREPLW